MNNDLKKQAQNILDSLAFEVTEDQETLTYMCSDLQDQVEDHDCIIKDLKQDITELNSNQKKILNLFIKHCDDCVDLQKSSLKKSKVRS